jgi:hypothetical protein
MIHVSTNTSTIILADLGSILHQPCIMARGRKREKPDKATTRDLMTSPLGTCLLKLFALGIIMEAYLANTSLVVYNLNNLYILMLICHRLYNTVGYCMFAVEFESFAFCI